MLLSLRNNDHSTNAGKKELRIAHCRKMLIDGISFIISGADDLQFNFIEFHFTKG